MPRHCRAQFDMAAPRTAAGEGPQEKKLFQEKPPFQPFISPKYKALPGTDRNGLDMARLRRSIRRAALSSLRYVVVTARRVLRR